MKEISKVYGPYIRKKDGRKHVVVYYIDSTHRTISYPRHIMEQHLGRELEFIEEVDHIDRDHTNNSIDNLQIVGRYKHRQLDALRAFKEKYTCPICKKEFYRSSNRVRHASKQNKSGPFCSKVCSGRYGSLVQYDEIPKLDTQPYKESRYFKLDK
jgi:hypothetical protein